MPKNWFADKLPQPNHQQYQAAPARTYAKPQEQMPVSPDGQWAWNGAEWVPNQQSQLPPPPPSAPQSLPQHAKNVAGRQDKMSGTCPMCFIDDTFFSSTPGAPRRCFSCGYNEKDRDFNQSGQYDTTPTVRGQGQNAPGVKQAGTDNGNFSLQNTQAPAHAQEYFE